jgi:hypothetical protein
MFGSYMQYVYQVLRTGLIVLQSFVQTRKNPGNRWNNCLSTTYCTLYTTREGRGQGRERSKYVGCVLSVVTVPVYAILFYSLVLNLVFGVVSIFCLCGCDNKRDISVILERIVSSFLVCHLIESPVVSQ